MTAPTETEIREALTQSIGGGYADEDIQLDWLRPLIDSDRALVRAVWTDDFSPSADHPGTLWADMRPSEYAELEQAIHDVRTIVERAATQELVNGLVEVAVAFAKAHPDIPRGHWPNGAAARKAAREEAEPELVDA